MKKRGSEKGSDSVEARERKFFVSGVHLVHILCVALLALNILLVYGIFISSQGIIGYRERSRQIEELDNKVRNLKKENQVLFKKIQDFKNDPRAQERLVREQLGWARDGEWVIEFLAPPR